MNVKVLSFLFTLLCIGITFQSVAQSINKKPNIVFFLVDDLGWTDVQPFGTKFDETPNIKQLAKESLLFTNAYAGSPVCSPTRASIMTGKYPTRLQTTDFLGQLSHMKS